jgi:UDP-N-acetylglucosamine 2-epimerase (non-hydrolysing)/GDP/UDP-N,N'-diacetylbacillosamine 2-epimerase (hydrolysing)
MYHGVLALARNKSLNILCIGNSSSGIKETPAFGCPTINIGSRQNGRLRANNVLDVDYDEKAIINAVEKCFSDDSFRHQCFNCENPYYVGGAGKKISEVLSSVELGQKLIRKKMTLLGEKNSGWYR